MKKKTFHKALSLLAHPFSLGMLALLLVNDHWLRHAWPSWWTGKLGDIAWLGFFPFALAAVLSAGLHLTIQAAYKLRNIPCDRCATGQTWVGPLAFGLTGLVFALAKTIPLFHQLTLQGFEALFGVPSTLVRDPSDLLALPVMLVGWRLWHVQDTPPVSTQAAGDTRYSRASALGLLMLPLAALLTLANSAAPNHGITCLAARDSKIYALVSFNFYASSDGGETWQGPSYYSAASNPFQSGSLMDGSPCRELEQKDWQELQASYSNLAFRYKSGETIQSSQDGGQTWQTAYQAQVVTQAERAYMTKTTKVNPTYQPGPLHAIEDPTNGNILFAMGPEGVLVRESSGEWRRVAVGLYRPYPSVPDFSVLQVLLGDQFILSFLTALLVYVILATPRLKLSRKWMSVLLWMMVITTGLIWLVVVLIFPPAISGYEYILVSFGLLSCGILLVVISLALTVDLLHSPAQRPLLPALLGIALGGGALFFLPSLLWIYNILPTVAWVVCFSLLFVTAVIIAAFWKLPGARKPPSPMLQE